MSDTHIVIELGPKRFALAKKRINGWWRVIATGNEYDIAQLKETLDERRPVHAGGSTSGPGTRVAEETPGKPVGRDLPSAYRQPGYDWGIEGVAYVYRHSGAGDWFYLDGHAPVRSRATVQITELDRPARKLDPNWEWGIAAQFTVYRHPGSRDWRYWYNHALVAPDIIPTGIGGSHTGGKSDPAR